MKGKITIVLLSLVLVFGMIAASCDNGTQPANPYPPATQTGPNTTTASDYKPSDADPSQVIAKKIKALNALAGGITLGTLGTGANFDAANKVVKVAGTGNPPNTFVAFTIAKADLPATFAAGDALKITYACVVESYDSTVNTNGKAHLAAKDGTGANFGANSSDNDNNYPQMDDTSKADKTVETKTLTITSNNSRDFTSGMRFQHNAYDGAAIYYIKITKVEKG